MINEAGLKWHRIFVDSFKNHFTTQNLNLFFKLQEPELTDSILEIFANLADEKKITQYKILKRDDIKKALYIESFGGPLVGQKYLTGINSLEYEVYILMTLKCLRYALFPNTNFKEYQQSVKVRIENFYRQQITTFWEVGTNQKINEDHYDFHRCVVRLMGKKNLDAVIVEDIQNFL